MNEKIAQSALMVGLCPLIPVPLVDGWLARRLQRQLYAQLAKDAGTDLDEATLDLLTEDRSNPVLGCLRALIWYPIKKLIRTLLYFFTVKDCFDWATDALHRAMLVRISLQEGLLPLRAKEVRTAMDEVMGLDTTSPLGRWVRGRKDNAVAVDEPAGLASVAGALHARGGGAVLAVEFRARLAKLRAG